MFDASGKTTKKYLKWEDGYVLFSKASKQESTEPLQNVFRVEIEINRYTTGINGHGDSAESNRNKSH